MRRFSDQEFRDLLDWFMCSDPWPLEADSHARMDAMLDAEAELAGFDDWIAAYHDPREGERARAE